MRNVLLLASMLFATGCPGFCGGFSGGNDTVYQRGSESLIVCGNGGFVANLTSGPVEGRTQEIAANAYLATRGDNAQRAFEYTLDGAGNLYSEDLGAPFQEAMLDTTALDHADVQCQDLETRAWWTAPSAAR
jgi:hypothetical protein